MRPETMLVLFELVLVFGGVLLFAWWQFRELNDYKTGKKTDKPRKTDEN